MKVILYSWQRVVPFNLLNNVLNSFKFRCDSRTAGSCEETQPIRKSPYFNLSIAAIEDRIAGTVRNIGDRI